MRQRLMRVSHIGILGIAACALLFCFAWMIVSHTRIHLNGTERAVFYRNSLAYYVIIMGLPIVIVLLCRILSSVPVQMLFLICAAGFLLLGIYMITQVTEDIRTDAWMVWDYAHRFNRGDYTGFDQYRYLNHYPFQIGLMTYERLVIRVWDSTHALFFLNLLFSIITNLFQWKLTTFLTDNETIQKAVILVSFAFLPHFFFVLFAYGQIPGLCMMTGGLYFLLCHLKVRKVWTAIVAGVLMGMAVFFKMNYEIGIIAAVIVVLLYMLQGKDYIGRGIVAIGMLILLPLIVNTGIESYYVHRYRVTIPEGEPMIAYIAMGLMKEDKTMEAARLGGWENGFTWDTYDEMACDTEVVAEISKGVIVTRLGEMYENPAEAVNFFITKLRSTWTDPTFQSIWSGPLEVTGQETHNFVLRSLYREGYFFDFVEVFMTAVVVWIYGGALAASIKRLFSEVKKEILGLDTQYALFVMLFFVGGFLYHMFSETKSQYVFMYVYLMIPLAVNGFDGLRLMWRKGRGE